MHKALSASVALVLALGMVACGAAPIRGSQPFSGRPDTVLDKFRTPDNRSDVILFCRNGDYYVYMDGSRSGSLNQYRNDERCVGK